MLYSYIHRHMTVSGQGSTNYEWPRVGLGTSDYNSMSVLSLGIQLESVCILCVLLLCVVVLRSKSKVKVEGPGPRVCRLCRCARVMARVPRRAC